LRFSLGAGVTPAARRAGDYPHFPDRFPAAWRFDYVRSDVIASGRIYGNCQRPQIDLYHRRRIRDGRETARLFREKGWFIGGYDVNADGLRALEKELGADNCVVRRLDVTDKPDYEKALAEFGAATGGKMDILYNNAGIGVGGPFDEQPFEDILRVVRVNFIGVLNGIHSAIGLLKATPNSLCFTTSSSSATYGCLESPSIPPPSMR